MKELQKDGAPAMSTKHTPGPWATLERIAAMDVTNTNAAMLARNEARDALVDDGPYEYRLKQRPTEWIRFHPLTFGPLGMSGEIEGQPWPATLLYADVLESRAAIAACEVQS